MNRRLSREDNPTVDKWLSAIEGTRTPQAVDGSPVHCDFCSEPIEPNTPTTSYVSKDLVNDEFLPQGRREGFNLLRVYCQDCDRQSIRFPCQGFAELLLAGYIDESHRLRDLSIADASMPSDGIPYDPVEVWEFAHSDMTWEDYNRATAHIGRTNTPIALGPGDIIDTLLLHGVDPNDVFTIEGDIIADQEELHEQVDRESIAEEFLREN